MLLIGSRALAEAGTKYTPRRLLRDWDFVARPEELKALKQHTKPYKVVETRYGEALFLEDAILDVEVASGDNRGAKLIDFVSYVGMAGWWNIVETFGLSSHVVTPEVVLLMKLSHRYLKDSPHFLKTMQDIRMLRKAGVQLPSDGIWQAYLAQREKDTYTYLHPNLNVKKGDFFDTQKTGVEQKYDHDSLHEVVALFDGRPAYTYYLKEGADVACDQQLFDKLPEEVKLAGVVEEAMVLALERSLVPYGAKHKPNQVFLFALAKVCTSITSGWFREYAWENYDAAVKLTAKAQQEKCFYEKFLEAKANGRIRLKAE